MTKLAIRIFTFLALTTMAIHGFAACDYPEKGTLPDGATATEAEMIEGQKAVKKFMADMDVYLECLDTEKTEAAVEGEDPEITAQREAITVKRHNAGVDELERLAADFNEQVRAYKNRDD